jgi:hypothetical protein
MPEMKGRIMELNVNNAGIFLAEAQTLRVNDGFLVSVDCVDGCLWITQDNDPRDIILAGGESFILDRSGVALLFAFRPSTIAVREPSSCMSR